jgi:putative ABC transport system substrate-binding protein
METSASFEARSAPSSYPTITLLGGAAAWPHVVRAQQPNRIPRLCFLTFDPGTLQTTRFGRFFDGLRDLGYVPGQTITIDYLTANGQAERYPALAAECVRLNADVIAVSTTPATQAAKTATRTIPIVMLSLGDPVGAGLVESLARPGGNVTGLSQIAPSLAIKRLEILKEFLPQISRVLVLTYLIDPIAAPQVKALEETANALGIKLQVSDIRAPMIFRWHSMAESRRALKESSRPLRAFLLSTTI